VRVQRDVVEPPLEQSEWGKRVHEALERRVRDGAPLPPALDYLEPVVSPILKLQGQMLVEHQMAVTEGFEPTGWDDENAWCRGIVDVGCVLDGGKNAVLLDWKTGRRKPDSDQLMLFAGLAFAHFPGLEKVKTGFVWLKDGAIDAATYTRADVQKIWMRFVPRVVRLQRAFEAGEFQPKPSGLCKQYCAVPRKLCGYSGRKEA